MILDSGRTGLGEIKDLAGCLRGCINLAQVVAVHGKIKSSKHSSNIYLANLLMEMYGKCGESKQARSIFCNIQTPNLFSWNIMLTAFAKNGAVQDAKLLFDTIPVRDIITWTAMVTAYARNGHLEEARRTFYEMPERNTVSCNTLMGACARNGDIQMAFEIFLGMPDQDIVTRTSIMGTYARSGYLKEARYVFQEMPEKDVVAWTALLQAYVDNGKVFVAKKMFDTMPSRSVVSWNVMLHSCGLELFHAMNLEGENPNENSFVGIFNACTHQGLVKDSLLRFCGMISDYGVQPTSEHLSCVVDLLGRVGRLGEAARALTSQYNTVEDSATPWIAMVSAAKMHGDLETGTWAGRRMVDLDPDCSASYALLSSFV